jgi:hypothetical protein
MDTEKKEIRKRKFLEGVGCLLYVIAFLIMGAVFLVKCSHI